MKFSVMFSLEKEEKSWDNIGSDKPSYAEEMSSEASYDKMCDAYMPLNAYDEAMQNVNKGSKKGTVETLI